MSLQDRRRIVALVLCLIGIWFSYPDARTAWRYRNRGPEAVSVDQLLAHPLPVGSWVTVSGIEWKGDSFTVTTTSHGNYGTNKSRSQYHLLVSPDDPGITAFQTVTKTLQTLDAQARTCPPAKRLALVAAYNRLLHEAQVLLASARPTQGIPLLQSLPSPSAFPEEIVDSSTQNSMQRIRRMVSAVTEEERARLAFEVDYQSVREPIARLLERGASETVTGQLFAPPEEVVDQYQEQLHLSPTLELRSGYTPLPGMIYVFALACGATFASLVWIGRANWGQRR